MREEFEMASGQKAARKKSPLIKIALIVMILGLAFLGYYFTLIKSAQGAYKPGDDSEIAITIPSGASTKRVASILEENGVIKSARGFVIVARQNGYDGKLQAGEYILKPSMDAESIMEALLVGRMSGNTLRFTLPEGLTRYQTAEKLVEQGILASVDDFMYLTTVHDGTQPDMSAMGEAWSYFSGGEMSAYRQQEFAEGFLMPNTYDIYVGSSTQDVINVMLGQFGKIFTADYAKKCEELGYTPYEVLIIASMIEKEAQTDEDRPLIASVIYNRLKKPQRLEIDATTLYALGDNKGYVTIADTETESPYNTYRTDGLPPTPICSPGAKAIDAALNPASTNYYYYVVSEKLDGSHEFAVNYEEHQANVQKYRAALKAAGRSY